MHNEDIERVDDREESTRAAVTAADDTGLVAQQEILVHTELDELDTGDVDGGVE
ncbi:MAG: hypothetical protein M3R53_01390 [Candidatus Eremiobacteraeota bacterium]|nr:hypothetical protein [Candidatus Eremiobacteraeota bacterium]